MAASTDRDEGACPVDHKTRDAWLAQARAAQASSQAASCAADRGAAPDTPGPSSSSSWTRALASRLPWSPSPPSPPPASRAALDTDRAISSIPRSPARPGDPGPPAPANHQVESGPDPSGNWVYPSEKMFFDAMRRKGHDARAADMKTVVPIHNAVNERAWRLIKEWEAPHLAGSRCGGPKLESFANRNDRMTPTARVNILLGYTAPFDRHDWVIDRCGTRVDYVIDFYAGRPGADARAGPSFYLDVRPKLNTWEGVKMRAMRWAGWA
ncbi:uncharacterized protein UV8b_04629 [Ustilaginoidea virens]|uniref:Holocytochrome c-type synthase n=1 Tax=Ustilaginoidea virens TaxID=1159556 RepID=A0A8E5MHC7_USTVR|nr:uncharacterized protein UV8b_04629 [Ustilaginoidea virens]QUC20388.1 hypothetical protein UV8b_04629 [Ustilaginoidea virens]